MRIVSGRRNPSTTSGAGPRSHTFAANVTNDLFRRFRTSIGERGERDQVGQAVGRRVGHGRDRGQPRAGSEDGGTSREVRSFTVPSTVTVAAPSAISNSSPERRRDPQAEPVPPGLQAQTRPLQRGDRPAPVDPRDEPQP